VILRDGTRIPTGPRSHAKRLRAELLDRDEPDTAVTEEGRRAEVRDRPFLLPPRPAHPDDTPDAVQKRNFAPARYCRPRMPLPPCTAL
jgi:hypothetical protein